jgi:hypothetical protein
VGRIQIPPPVQDDSEVTDRDWVYNCSMTNSVMHWEREKLVDIWFVFRILEFEVNFGDFICVFCIVMNAKSNFQV